MDFAAALVPKHNARTYNGALMELGALLCTPRKPQCLRCPVKAQCRTREPEALPVKKPQRKTVELEERCAFIVRNGEVLLEQQTGRRWNGLWRLPLCEKPDGPLIYQAEYPFTHHRVTLLVTRGETPRKPAESQSWHPLESLQSLPMTAPHRRALASLLRT
ncbi:MAG: hypothetical protein QM796_06300 [Chthoniobacteraceae bacterium]